MTDGEVHLKIESEMAKRFRFYSLDQIYLLPPSLNEWLPEGHLARFIAEVTKELDLKPLLSRYENSDGRGLAAYNPVLMLRLLLYGYCTGRRSSRQIETATYDEVPFREKAVLTSPGSNPRPFIGVPLFPPILSNVLLSAFHHETMPDKKPGVVFVFTGSNRTC